MFDEFTLTWIKRGAIALLVTIIVVTIFLKKFVFFGQSNEPLSKKLLNFISKKENDKQKWLNSNYDTIEKGHQKKKKSNKRNKNTTIKLTDNNIDVDQNTNNYNEMYGSDSLSNIIEKENNQKIKKLVRFGEDYCRASPNISLNQRDLLDIGWRTQKFLYNVDYEVIDYKGYKQTIQSLMTALPINKALIQFEDDFTRENYSKAICSIVQNHINFIPYLHFDILPSQKLMIKIQKINQNGSLRDLLNNTNPLTSYSKKYPLNRGKGLHLSLISLYGRQILEALHYLHSHNWYHMHLHSGNVLIEDNSNIVKITELENFANDLPIRNEHLLNYVFNNLNSDHFTKSRHDHTSTILSEIFKNNFNIFEKIDMICFGRILYEMNTGRELRAPFPDLIEYKEMESEVAEILKLIFKKKMSRANLANDVNLPEVTASELLNMKLFKCESSIYKEENMKHDPACVSQIDESNFLGDYENGGSYIKEKLFNQNTYIKLKLRKINSYLT